MKLMCEGELGSWVNMPRQCAVVKCLKKPKSLLTARPLSMVMLYACLDVIVLLSILRTSSLAMLLRSFSTLWHSKRSSSSTSIAV
jgi:hypothetical protein